MSYAILYFKSSYWSTFMGKHQPAYLTKLQCLQNETFRKITNCELRASINLYYFNLGISKLSELCKLEIAKLLH